MSGVHLAQTDYIPLLPERTITSGAISKAQFEDIVLDENATSRYSLTESAGGFSLVQEQGMARGVTILLFWITSTRGEKRPFGYRSTKRPTMIAPK